MAVRLGALGRGDALRARTVSRRSQNRRVLIELTDDVAIVSWHWKRALSS